MQNDKTLTHLCEVRAVFRPRRTDDLKRGASARIGQEGIFKASWIIEDDQTYAGEWAMEKSRLWDDDFDNLDDGWIWIPSGDLEILEVTKEGLCASSAISQPQTNSLAAVATAFCPLSARPERT